jgi:hypothetical protein
MPMPDTRPARKRWTLALGCFALGCAVGFAAGVLSVKGARQFVVGLFATERSAAVEQSVAVVRPAFRFEYPGNWRVDSTDSDYDPDHMFSVDSPGQSFVMFVIADGDIEPKEAVEQHVSVQTARAMKDATRTPLTKWGRHDGEGVLLTGRHLGITRGTIRVFAFRERETTYTVIESTFDDDRDKVQPGFDLIARTFRVKGSSP